MEQHPFFMPPISTDWGHIVFGLPVYLQKTLILAITFETESDTAFIFHNVYSLRLDLFFDAKVKAICKGQISRSGLKKNVFSWNNLLKLRSCYCQKDVVVVSCCDVCSCRSSVRGVQFFVRSISAKLCYLWL